MRPGGTSAVNKELAMQDIPQQIAGRLSVPTFSGMLAHQRHEDIAVRWSTVAWSRWRLATVQRPP
jgi:hypothetical protein